MHHAILPRPRPLAALAFGAMCALATFALLVRPADAQTPTATPTPTSTATPAPATPPDRRLELAPVEAVEVQVAKSNPPQYQAVVTSGLPGGCAAFDSISARRTDTRIDVTVQNSMPVGNVPCTAIYGYTKNAVNLGSDFQTGVTYTVVVNAASPSTKRVTFVGGAASPVPDATPPAATPVAPRPANTGSAGANEVDAIDAVVGGSAMLAAAVAVALLAVRVPRRR